MSDNMERDRNEPLTAKEIEEEEKEEMKRELMAMGMYETDYTYKEMKDILGFISESKDMANKANDNKNSQKESMHSSEEGTSDPMPKTNLVQELETQEHTDTSGSIHSHRPNHTSPILHRISIHSSSSAEPTSAVFVSRISAHRRMSSDDDMFDRLHDNPSVRDTHSTNRYVSLRSRNSLQESHNTHTGEVKMDTQSEHNQKLDRWRMNPLDSCVNEDDVPLLQPDRPLVQDREPFRSCKDAQTPETLEKLLVALNLHLRETAELWHSWHRSTDSKFQWGSPIQVGTAKGSLDKKPLTNVKTEQNKMESTGNYSHERPNKRKSTLVVSSPNARHSSSDEDEKADFVIVKKKKTQSYEGTSRVLRSNRNTRVAKNIMSSSILRDDEDDLFDNDKISINPGDTDTKNLQTESQKMSEEDRVSPELVPTYSKRIRPPNTRRNLKLKKKHNVTVSTESSLVRNSDEEQSAITLIPKKKSNTLGDKEILAELEKDSSEDSPKAISKSTEIKPLPMKGLSVRLEKQFMLLKKAQMEKDRKIEMEKEEAQKKEEEERRRKEEFYKRQVEERQEKERQREEINTLRKEKSAQWNEKLNTRSKEIKERLRLQEQNETRLLELEEENRLLQDSSNSENEVQAVEDSETTNINCPICNESFPSDKIEMHAAACEQYNTDNDEDNISIDLFENKSTKRNIKDSQFLECDVCSTYRTTNGIHYEEHVNKCLQKQHQQEKSQPYEGPSIEIDNIPTSPIRCYQPISEQTDSEIDYRAQFASNSKPHTSKKRKR